MGDRRPEKKMNRSDDFPFFCTLGLDLVQIFAN